MTNVRKTLRDVQITRLKLRVRDVVEKYERGLADDVALYELYADWLTLREYYKTTVPIPAAILLQAELEQWGYE